MRRSFSICILTASLLAGFSLTAFADDEPTPHAVIDRALKAGGGADKIKQFKAVSFKADMQCDDEKYTVSGLFAGPSLFRMEFDGKESKVIVGRGDSLWIKDVKKVTEHAPGEASGAFEGVMACFYAMSLPDRLLSLKGKEWKLKILGEQAVNGVESVALKATHALYPEATIWFDKETGFPVKTQLALPTAKDEGKQLIGKAAVDRIEVFFDDYKQFDGVWHFTKVRVRGGDDIFDCQIRELKLHKKYDSGSFKKPG